MTKPKLILVLPNVVAEGFVAPDPQRLKALAKEMAARQGLVGQPDPTVGIALGNALLCMETLTQREDPELDAKVYTFELEAVDVELLNPIGGKTRIKSFRFERPEGLAEGGVLKLSPPEGDPQ